MASLNSLRLLTLLPLLFLQFGRSTQETEVAGAASTLNKDCSCGFYDSNTGNLFTESIIIYFNETSSFPTGDFTIEEYQHKYEKDWNGKYREGANATNVVVRNVSQIQQSSVFTENSLGLYVDPSDHNHLVMGSEIRSIRQDIQFGSVSALIRGPPKSNRGSAMSMLFNYNETQNWEMDLLNSNEADDAWMTTLFKGEFAARSLGVNYSTLGNTSLSNYTADPWDYVNLRVDWDKKSINFTYGGVLARSVKRDKKIPSVPGSLVFRHWANGDKYTSMGPPYARTGAHVGWIRSFFNASTTKTKEEIEDFDERCTKEAACPMEDITLRGSTGYSSVSTIKWKQKLNDYALKIFAIIIVSIGTGIGLIVVINALLRRCLGPRSASKPQMKSSSTAEGETLSERSSGSDDVVNGHRTNTSHTSEVSSTVAFSTSHHQASSSGTRTAVNSRPPSTTGHLTPVPDLEGPRYTLPLEHNEHQHIGFAPFEVDPPQETDEIEKEVTPAGKDDDLSKNKGKAIENPPMRVLANRPEIAAPIAPVRNRVDYMAGLVAICSMIVTWSHFSLTFLPSLTHGTDAHYKSELVMRKTLGPFTLNAIWLGPFFTTSTRFLITGYLKGGDLKSIAEKTVARPFRLMIPVTGVVILEYFLIDAGATKWLEYLPSVSWSTWPYVVRYQNFGTFMNEVLELFYLIPNAAPQITFNYCTGVLWTIPVSLQGSWICLMGVLVIREIKTPWKRFGYYTFCVVVNWYARNFGGYFWAGLLLADIDIVYKYRKWLYARWWAHWGLGIFCVIASVGMLSWDNIQVDLGVSLPTIERGIHPDYPTGRPLAQTENAGYPNYTEPRLNGIVFAFAIQLLVEICPPIQRFVSSKVLLWVFPHIFTIYLFHGLIFWSLGSLLCVKLSAAGLPYWANMLVTATACYLALFGSLELVTPAVEMLGKHCTAMIWRNAYEAPVKKKSTLFPFDKELLLGRPGADPSVATNEEQEKAADQKAIDVDEKKAAGKAEKRI